MCINVQFSSVTQLCPTHWDPMDCSTPGLPIHHQLPELTQIHVRWVSDAIQLSHPLSSPFPLAFSLFLAAGSFPVSQFFTSGGQSIEVSASASVAYNGCSLSTFRPMSQGQCWPCPPLFPTQLMSRASSASVEAWVPLSGQGWEQWVSTCLSDPVGKTKTGGVCFMIQGAF